MDLLDVFIYGFINWFHQREGYVPKLLRINLKLRSQSWNIDNFESILPYGFWDIENKFSSGHVFSVSRDICGNLLGLIAIVCM